ncbi:MAG TPA: VOC family protein [Acidobacteriaceae bacterium]|nr:VOC family protein [Acidobacteriaceae bacterium]
MTTTSPLTDTSSPFTSWRFEHAAIRVPDFETAAAWYVEKLDFRLIRSASLNEKTYGFLIAPADGAGFSIELIAGPGAENRPAYQNLGSSLKLAGLHHLAFRVSSVDDSVTTLQHRGVTIVSEAHDVPKLSLRVAFFADPWGNLFELIQPMKG